MNQSGSSPAGSSGLSGKTKVAVTSTAPRLDAPIDERFGRCAYFMVVDLQDLSFEAIENVNASRGGGAGIQSAQMMANRGVTTVLTGFCGPNAHETLAAAGIGVILGCKGTVSSIVEELKVGKLTLAKGSNAAEHAGK